MKDMEKSHGKTCLKKSHGKTCLKFCDIFVFNFSMTAFNTAD